ncbi:MAG: ABC transporter ATP-binding protein [Clostridiales Family XIII bacterium]|nr:ABC transporter ATP-binding protein [Clostridiales Family XIII bacterium]
MKSTVIKTEKLSKTFSTGGVQQHVLKNIDLEIYEGDFTVIMGASGAGKSTLLYALSGMDRPSLGKIEFAGASIGELSGDKLAVFRRKNCGFVFQQIYLMDDMSLLDNAMACGLLLSKDKKAVAARAADLFDRVGLEEIDTKKFPAQLSGGQQQRGAMVRALINDPTVLFADEPTGALNSASGKAVLDILTELNRAGKSIVMVTHDLHSAYRGNRILYLKDGAFFADFDAGRYEEADESRKQEIRTYLESVGW